MNDRIRVIFFNEAGQAVREIISSPRQLWGNGDGTDRIRIVTGTEWSATPLEQLPNMSEIPENLNA